MAMLRPKRFHTVSAATLAVALLAPLPTGTASAAEPFPATISPSDIKGRLGHRIRGLKNFDLTGATVASAGDVNGDGLDDILVTAPNALRAGYEEGGRGSAYVVFGRSGVLSSRFSLATLDGSDGFRIDGAAPGHLTAAVSAGDVNGDGFADIMVHTYREWSKPTQRSLGTVHVLYGRAAGFPAVAELASLPAEMGFQLTTSGYPYADTMAIAGAGDINADGLGDMLVGVPYVDLPGRRGAGQVYVVFGRKKPFPPVTRLERLQPAHGFRIIGGERFDHLGQSMAAAGDVNGDGIDDIALVGEGRVTAAGPEVWGSAYIVFGRKARFPQQLNPAQLAPTRGFRIATRSGIYEDFVDATAAGDFNGDGVGDLILGSSFGAYVVFGGTEPFPALLSVEALDGANGFRLDERPSEGGNPLWWESLSGEVSSAGDVNGDGLDDIIVSADSVEEEWFGLDEYRRWETTQAHVVFGHPSPTAAVHNLSELDGLNGFRAEYFAPYTLSVSPAGDFNGDGHDDFLLGVPSNSSDVAPAPGSAYLMYGRKVEATPPPAE